MKKLTTEVPDKKMKRDASIAEPVTLPKHAVYHDLFVVLDPDTYIVVVHEPTHRAFTMDRGYELMDSDLPAIEAPVEGIVSVYFKWLPTMKHQRPAWIEEYPEAEFTGYWYPA